MIGATGRRIRGCYGSSEWSGGPQTGSERVDLQPDGFRSAPIAGLADLAGAAVSSWRGAMILPASSEAMQLRLDLGGSLAPAAALWELVGAEERQSAIALLAALIAQVVAEGRGDEPTPVRDRDARGGGDRR
jgi:hypothetical protein